MSPVLSDFGTGIWILFIFYFVMRLAIVANRAALLKKNWLFVLAIAVSALRFFPFLQPFPLVRVVTATFGIQVIWILASADQGMRFLRGALGRRGSGYALVLTFVVMFSGATGILHFEGISTDPQNIHTYPKALWWTAMQMTNIGSSYSIKTTGGRIIDLGISVYAAAMFGYVEKDALPIYTSWSYGVRVSEGDNRREGLSWSSEAIIFEQHPSFRMEK